VILKSLTFSGQVGGQFRLPLKALLGAGQLLTVLVVVFSALSSHYVLAAIIGLALLTVAVTKPISGLYAVIASEVFGLVFALSGYGELTNSALVPMMLFAATLSITVRSQNGRVKVLLLSVLFIILPSLVVGVTNLEPLQAINGTRIFLEPIACGVVGFSLTKDEIKGLTRFAVIAVTMSLIAAIVQNALGVTGLVAHGIEHGSNFRLIDGVIRPPGLFLTHFGFGSFAGVVATVCVIWLPELGSSRKWRVFAVMVSVSAMLASTTRVAFLFLMTGVLLWIVTSYRRRVVEKVVALFTVTAVLWWTLVHGIGGLDSWASRIDLWSRLVETYRPSFFGLGIGSVGSSSLSSFNVSGPRVVVDNYFISLVLQFGIPVSAIIVIMIMGLAVWMCQMRRSSGLYYSGLLLVSMLVAFMFNEFWEMRSAMALLALVVGYSLGQGSLHRESPVDPVFAFSHSTSSTGLIGHACSTRK